MKPIIAGFTAALLLAGCGKQAETPEANEVAEPTVETVEVSSRPPEFQQCAVCHSDKAGDPNKLGPNLFGVFGTRAGTHAKAFDYSPDMRRAGFTWDRDKLEAYIESPIKVVPGTKMVFVGQKDPAKRKAIVDYLETLR